jgi:tetratricopeptide (TPR) repeat protein
MKKILFFIVFFYSISANAALDVAKIKLELAKLEIKKDKEEGLKKCEELFSLIEQEEENGSESAELYTWKGIILAKMAHYNAPAPKALSLAKDARDSLEKAVLIDEKNSGAAALNALGIIYHKVPRFISFGDNEKSEEYFKRAILISNNLDTNWRYGEFLIDVGKKTEGLKLLKTALSKVDKRKADEKIKAEIIKNLIKKNEL